MGNLARIMKALTERPRNFSDLKERTDLANGVLQHHVKHCDRIIEEKGALMLSEECGKCQLEELCTDGCIRNILGDRRKKFILENFEKNSQASISRQMDVSRPTVHHHVEILRQEGLIQEDKIRSEIKPLLDL